ncbi:MAG: hypothetical protein ACE5JU_20575 [Candidatus Binatia bacterium]
MAKSGQLAPRDCHGLKGWNLGSREREATHVNTLHFSARRRHYLNATDGREAQSQKDPDIYRREPCASVDKSSAYLGLGNGKRR